LGIAQLKLSQYSESVESLTKGLQVAQAIGDRFLMASNFAHLAAAYQGTGNSNRPSSRAAWECICSIKSIPRMATTGCSAQHSLWTAGTRKLSNYPG
jgi:hypothetical protein